MAPINGGMEHQTMTTLGYFDNELVAHELAHQWWGDHVTCGSWSDIWLNEGFATYSEYLMLEKLFPGSEKAKLSNIHNAVLSVTNGSTWVKDSLNEKNIFSRKLVYDKGAAIIHTLRYMINNDLIFFQALQNFQTEFAFRTATASDFKKSVEKTTGINLTAFFNQWYYGHGYPTYAAKISRKSDNSSELLVSQKGSSPSNTPLFTNPIDILVSRMTKSDTLMRVNIQENPQKISFSAEIGLKDVIEIDPFNFIVNRTEQFTNQIDTINESILIYPNPSQNFINIELKNSMSATVKLFSMDGKIVLEKSFSKETQLDIHRQTAGNYLLIIENDNTIFEKKITKN
jgi:aminopeptidase N